MASVGLSGLWLSQQVWQLGDIHRNPPRLIARRSAHAGFLFSECLRRRADFYGNLLDAIASAGDDPPVPEVPAEPARANS
jgi:hypothetical protein